MCSTQKIELPKRKAIIKEILHEATQYSIQYYERKILPAVPL